MDNVKLIDQTFDAIKPESWNEELDGPIQSVSVHCYTDVQSGLPFMRTVWRPDEAELVALMAGGSIVLDLCVARFPVMRIFASEPD